MTGVPMVCPICNAKNESSWGYLCPKCWIDFCEWVRKKYGYSDIPIPLFLPEYMIEYKMKVQFS